MSVSKKSELQLDQLERLGRSVNLIHSPYSAWIVLSASVILTIAAYIVASQQVAARAEERFTYRATEIAHAIEERMAHYEQTLRGSAALFNASSKVTREEWADYVSSLDLNTNLPGIQGLGYAVPVAAENKDEFEAGVQAEGFPDFHISPPGARATYSAILYLEPFDWRNQRAFGFDMWSNAMRREAMQRARDSGDAATSGVITLVQETDKDTQKGFLTYFPIYRGGATPVSLQDRQTQFIGWVYAAFRAGNLMQGILGDADDSLRFAIYDGSEIVSSALIFSSASAPSTAEYESSKSLFSTTMNLVVQGRPWTIGFASNENIVDPREAALPRYVLIAGIVVECLLFYVVMTLHFLNRRARKLANDMFVQHRDAKAELQRQFKRVEYKAKEADAFFQLAPEAFLIVDSKGHIVGANKAAEVVFGYAEGELETLDVDDLVPLESKGKHKEHIRQYFSAPHKALMRDGEAFQATKKNGDSVAVNINLVPITRNDGEFVVAAIRDVSVQKKIEENLLSAKQNAEQANKSKSEFLANMSHEIRTPLNAVIGTVQLLEKTSLTQEQSKYLGMIGHAGKSLLMIVNDILDLSKIEAGQMLIENEPFYLSDVVEHVAAIMSVTAQGKGLELVIVCDPTVPDYIQGDAFRLQQILINLVSNAIKFTHTGYVHVYLSLVLDHNGLSILTACVKDSGIGISPEQQEQLFSAFSQADTSITRRFGGTGLGLVISSKLLTLMGGQITLKSQSGVGTEFTASMPIGILPSEPERQERESKTSLRVLLMSKSSAVKQSLQYICQSLRWHLDCVSDLTEAIGYLQGNRKPYDRIVVIDALPPSNGDAAKYFNEVVTDQSLSVYRAFSGDAGPASLEQDVVNTGMLRVPITTTSLRTELLLKNEMTAQVAEPQIQESMPLAGANILLVEDNEFNQTIACDLLSDFGATVDVAENGLEALEKLNSSANYALILMDVQMPEMDGLTATKKIRETLGLSLPIIAMSAGVMAEEKRVCFDVGMDDFLPKPIDAEQIQQTLSKYYSPPNGRAALSDSNAGEEALASGEYFDSARLERLINGKAERLEKIRESLQRLINEERYAIQNGRSALQQGDETQAKFIFHALKGVVSNYGAEALSASIRNLEMALAQGEPSTRLEPLLSQIELDFERFLEAAQNWLRVS